MRWWLQKFIPFGVSLVATPIALLLGLFSAGAGHGNYIIATLLFPFTVLGFVLSAGPPYGDSEPKDTILIASAIIQFPIYGLLFSIVSKRILLAIIIGLTHFVLFVVTFFLAYRTGFL